MKYKIKPVNFLKKLIFISILKERYLKNQESKLRLETKWFEKNEVWTLSPNLGEWQIWKIVKTGNNCVNLVNKAAAGQCLDTNDDGYVYVTECNGGSYQNWSFQNLLLINCETKSCLESKNDGNVYALQCNGSKWQNWINA